MEAKLKVKLTLAIGKRKALVHNAYEKHKKHMERAEFFRNRNCLEYFEAHLEDMRNLEDVICKAIREVGLFTDALQKISIKVPISSEILDIMG